MLELLGFTGTTAESNRGPDHTVNSPEELLLYSFEVRVGHRQRREIFASVAKHPHEVLSTLGKANEVRELVDVDRTVFSLILLLSLENRRTQALKQQTP